MDHTQQHSGTEIQTRRGGKSLKGCAGKAGKNLTGHHGARQVGSTRPAARTARHGKEGKQFKFVLQKGIKNPKGVEKGGAFGGGTYRHWAVNAGGEATEEIRSCTRADLKFPHHTPLLSQGASCPGVSPLRHSTVCRLTPE
jgi:hypothetical protein